jgi:hypothetical protein
LKADKALIYVILVIPAKAGIHLQTILNFEFWILNGKKEEDLGRDAIDRVFEEKPPIPL